MRVAVTSEDFHRVTGHAGRSRRFLVFEAEGGGSPRETYRLTLLPEQTIGEFVGVGPHPFDNFCAIITAQAGEGFIGRLAARGIHTVVTKETDPLTAVTDFIASSAGLPSPRPAWGPNTPAGEAIGVLKSLANETRLMILFALGDGEKCVSDIERGLGISQPRTSQQLNFLRRAGLVEGRRLGSTTVYRLTTPHVLFAIEAIYQIVCAQHRRRRHRSR
jgi:DNA-binding transcriptional ArsR family regulator/predicted Fe-Mo cluster-binding NifX family protein